MIKSKKIKIIFFVILITLFGFIFYWNSSYYIISHRWQATQGSDIGDFMFYVESDNDNYIKGRIVYLNGKPHCKIVFCYYKTLFLADLEGKYNVEYVAKD
jgi:hypothetical protein